MHRWKKSAGLDNAKLKKRPEAVSYDDEQTLWINGTFGVWDTSQIIDTGLHFILRVDQEKRYWICRPSSNYFVWRKCLRVSSMCRKINCLD